MSLKESFAGEILERQAKQILFNATNTSTWKQKTIETECFHSPFSNAKAFFHFSTESFFFLFVLLLELAVGVCVMCKQQHLRRKHLKSASESGEKCLWMWCCCCIVGECFFPNICRLLWVYGMHKKIIKKISEKVSRRKSESIAKFSEAAKGKIFLSGGVRDFIRKCLQGKQRSQQPTQTHDLRPYFLWKKRNDDDRDSQRSLSLRLFSSGFLVLRQNKISLCFFFSCHEKLLCVGVERAA